MGLRQIVDVEDLISAFLASPPRRTTFVLPGASGRRDPFQDMIAFGVAEAVAHLLEVVQKHDCLAWAISILVYRELSLHLLTSAALHPFAFDIMSTSWKELYPMGKGNKCQSHVPPAWRWISERGLRIETGDATLAYYAALISKNLPQIEDLVPADGSLLLILRRGKGVSAELRAALCAPPVGEPMKQGALHEIAVGYGGIAGPDLPELAERAGMDAASYINRHAAVEYSVAFLGFQPGFPYLQGLPRALHVPRRASPRVRVAAGSVAIGGTYTGIYPARGPGGWHIIGRTTAALFDPQREAPALLMAGDRVRFVPI